MLIYTDQMQRTIRLEQAPKRIVSLVPSQTELLHFLGLEEEVIGITKFCIHPPEWFKNKTRVGGTKKINFDAIEKLQPHLIIANKEENEKKDIEELEKKYPVWLSEIYNLNDALQMIGMLGTITNTGKKASQLQSFIISEFDKLARELKNFRTKKVAYLIWKNPYMVAGTTTFINDMLQRCHLENVYTTATERYPVTDLDELEQLNPEIIFLSSEPYPFKQLHINEIQDRIPNAKIKLVDGELFSWYGSRLIHSSAYFSQIVKNLL